MKTAHKERMSTILRSIFLATTYIYLHVHYGLVKRIRRRKTRENQQTGKEAVKDAIRNENVTFCFL